ncbi:MAG: SMP-30/gluconolactonase/LRE family protein [Elioraea sp.]|nr:SMP-30/gluconolactonase/LRE family protein [Elioraea sp.]
MEDDGTAITMLTPGIRLCLGESPVWDAEHGRLLVADIWASVIHAFSLEGEHLDAWYFPAEVGSLGLCRSGRWIVALRDEVVLYDWRRRRAEPLCRPTPIPPYARLNDGKVGPDGAFWVGSMDERSPRGAVGCLFRICADGGWEQVAEGLLTSNGLAWTPDGRTMLHSDSGEGWIDAWDFDPATGKASNRRRIASLDPAAHGRPDGAAFDAAGVYWSAGVRLGRINRFLPDGTLLSSQPFPVPGPTMPCFAGEDLRTLVWTTLRTTLGAEMVGAHPLSGALFAMRVEVPGVPIARFAD